MNEAMGIDLKMEDGDLVIEDGDLATVEGVECLKADLYCRLLSSPGDLVLHPEFGCGLQDLVSRPAGPANVGRIGDVVRKQVLAEPRVKSLGGVEVVAVGKCLYITLRGLMLIDGQVVGNMVFPLEMEV